MSIDEKSTRDYFATECIAAGYSRLFKRDPIEYWRTVAERLPNSSRRMRRFKNVVVSRLLLEETFILASRGQALRAITSLFTTMSYDRRTIVNRGAWKAILSAVPHIRGARRKIAR